MLGSSEAIGFIPSRDPSAAKGFYAKVLGLEIMGEDQFAVVLKANQMMVRLVKVEELSAPPYTIFGWEVADIEQSVEQLRSLNVLFEKFPWLEQDDLGIWTAPNGDKVAWFKDPDGNTLSLSQHVWP